MNKIMECKEQKQIFIIIKLILKFYNRSYSPLPPIAKILQRSGKIRSRREARQENLQALILLGTGLHQGHEPHRRPGLLQELSSDFAVAE